MQFNDGDVVCVVCAGNRGRSPMFAELLRRELAKSRIPLTVVSAGYHEIAATGATVHPKWSEVAGARDVDLSAHRTTAVQTIVEQPQISAFICIDRLVVDEVKKLSVPGAKLYLPLAPDGIPDPVHGGPDAWDSCYVAIQHGVRELMDEIGVRRFADTYGCLPIPPWM